MIATSLDSASHLLNWSNVMYVGGAALTVAAAMYLLYENRLISQGKSAKDYLLSKFFAAFAAIISLVGTIGAIHYGNIVSHLKDVDLVTYKTSSGVQIANANRDAAQARSDAATANQKAEEAKQKVAELELKNKALGGSVATNLAAAQKAEADLANQNKATSDFAHSLAQQQGIMNEQSKVSPQLGPEQVQMLATMLRPLAGPDVEVHTTSDTVVERLASAIATALNSAGIAPKSFSTDMGALYQGVSVAVNDPKNVPPLANALVNGLRQFGIDVHPVAAPQMVTAGHVGIFLGPN